MRCPHCSNKLLQKSGGRTRVRTQGQIVFDEEGICKSKCYWCKGDVVVPMELSEGTEVVDERFVIKKAGKEVDKSG